ncbi:general substrate transporter [Hortaea werneckii]|nr:general substrate transporter [Hortaea werneckii]
MFAMSGIPICWDQGSAGTVATLPGFQEAFGISSSSSPTQISNYVSLVYIGCGFGAAASFFINDRLGRLWSFRLYAFIWILGQMIATGSGGSLGALYTSRIVSGLGIGALTVLGPISLVEIAPTEIRGLITVWFSIGMLLSLFVAAFCNYGIFLHVPAGRLQYQIVWFSPCIFMALVCLASFFGCICESPRWLFLVGQSDQGTASLAMLRGLPVDHPRVANELEEIKEQIKKEQGQFGIGANSSSWTGIKAIIKEAFTVKANIRRVQQVILSYALAQLSGANSVTTYFVPILNLVGIGDADDQTRSLFLTAMYSFAKFWFTIIASFFFIDALGRRRSMYVGVIIQMVSDVYIGVFLKYKQADQVSGSAGQAAIAMIFLHGFGYAVGLLVLPYVFVAEVWPNQLRSFGAALGQTFHWWFFFGISKATPSILSSMDNWGAFLFFAGWCFVSLIYVFFVVPELAGQSLEEIDAIFEGPWYLAYRTSKNQVKQQSDTLHGLPRVDTSSNASERGGKEQPKVSSDLV